MRSLAIEVRVRPHTNLLPEILQDIPALPIADMQDWRHPDRSAALGLVVLASFLLKHLEVPVACLQVRDFVWT